MKWISVKDKLPPQGFGYVLVSCSDRYGKYSLARLNKDDKWEGLCSIDDVIIGVESGENRVVFKQNDVTHWMSVPLLS